MSMDKVIQCYEIPGECRAIIRILSRCHRKHGDIELKSNMTKDESRLIGCSPTHERRTCNTNNESFMNNSSKDRDESEKGAVRKTKEEKTFL